MHPTQTSNPKNTLPLAFIYCTLGFVFFVTATQPVNAYQEWQVYDTGTGSSLRGLCAVDDRIAWACGSQGTVIRTIDGGVTWAQHPVTDLPDSEFRSIYAWDAERVIVGTAGQPTRIMKSNNAGADWTCVYHNPSPQAFLDGLTFWDQTQGLAFSDPVDGQLLILKTVDQGETWAPISSQDVPPIEKGEAGFAASNSSLAVFADRYAWIGLGGGVSGSSRVFHSKDGGKKWMVHTVEPIARNESSGIFSVAFQEPQRGIAVGGNYPSETDTSSNIAITQDGGRSWRSPKGSRPRGFRSSIVFVKAQTYAAVWGGESAWIACGPTGCDWSSDGETWHALSDVGFHALYLSPEGSVWASGSNGRVARLLPSK